MENGNVLKYQVAELKEAKDDHEVRIRKLEVGQAKLFVLMTAAAAIGSFLASHLF